MQSKRFLSWNVNGIRAIEKKGFLNWLAKESPYILALQETKALTHQLSENLLKPEGYFSFWNSAQRKGYSGVAVYAKEKPLSIRYGMEDGDIDIEGRILILEYENFIFVTCYFPNGRMNDERLSFKLSYYAEFQNCLKRLRKRKKTLIVCGDFNTAHKEIDLAHPKENETLSGFLPSEREWMDSFVASGMVDTLRVYNHEAQMYSWWDYKTRARERNIGWRLDYFFIDKDSVLRLKDAFICHNVYGSDHCPVGIDIVT